jgi:hypothetical protein
MDGRGVVAGMGGLIKNDKGRWNRSETIKPHAFICGHCQCKTGNDQGYYLWPNAEYRIYICPVCVKPTFIDDDAGGRQTPGVPYGDPVRGAPAQVTAAYDEARHCMSVAAWTAAVLLCRKILMAVAVNEGAPTNQSFQQYVTYLVDNAYVTPKARGWVDEIRKRGNEATHEIPAMSQHDARELLTFVEMLLKTIYEFPAAVSP